MTMNIWFSKIFVEFGDIVTYCKRNQFESESRQLNANKDH